MAGWLAAVHPNFLHVRIGRECLCQSGQLAAQFHFNRKKHSLLDCVCTLDYHLMAFMRIAY